VSLGRTKRLMSSRNRPLLLACGNEGISILVRRARCLAGIGSTRIVPTPAERLRFVDVGPHA
jgi:hypothetical protein